MLGKILQRTKEVIRKVIPTTTISSGIGDMNKLLEDLKIRGLKCDSILDVGANRCEWSNTAFRFYPHAHFYLIEPQLEMLPLLKTFKRKHQQCDFYLAGAGANEGELVLTIWDDLAGSSFLPSANASLKEHGKQRNVPIITIDGLLVKGMKMPQLIKLDIQGFELEALKGASQTFGKTEVYILEVSLFKFEKSENAPSFFDVLSFMHERGYVVYDFPGFLHRPFDGALGQCDICFVKEQSFLRASNKW
jgi:FkbM family methyltransferase